MITRLEYDDGDRHRKYWQVELLDLGSTAIVQTEWGRIGAPNPGSQIKTFVDFADAEKHVKRMINSKIRKGYQEFWGAKTVEELRIG